MYRYMYICMYIIYIYTYTNMFIQIRMYSQDSPHYIPSRENNCNGNQILHARPPRSPRVSPWWTLPQHWPPGVKVQSRDRTSIPWGDLVLWKVSPMDFPWRLISKKNPTENHDNSHMYIFIYLFAYLFIYVIFTYLFVYLFVCLCIYLFIYVFMYLFIIFIYLFVYLFICLFIYLFIYYIYFLFIYLFSCLFICFLFIIFIYLLIYLFMCIYPWKISFWEELEKIRQLMWFQRWYMWLEGDLTH